jgi:hypothetical protein
MIMGAVEVAISVIVVPPKIRTILRNLGSQPLKLAPCGLDVFRVMSVSVSHRNLWSEPLKLDILW